MNPLVGFCNKQVGLEYKTKTIFYHYTFWNFVEGKIYHKKEKKC